MGEQNVGFAGDKKKVLPKKSNCLISWKNYDTINKRSSLTGAVNMARKKL